MVTARTALVFSLAFATTARCAENLLRNGDFEEGEKAPAGWTFTVFSTNPSRGTYQWSADAHTGEHAVKLVGVENAGKEAVRYLVFSQPIAVTPGLFKLTGWYKAEGGAQAHLHIPMYLADFAEKQFGTPVGETIYRDLPAATEWSPFEFDINVKGAAKQVLVMLRASDIGAVHFDDVVFARVEAPLVLRLYPAEFGRGDTLPLVRGAPNFARIMLMGDRSKIEGAAEVRLDLPEGAGDFGLLPGTGPVERNGQPCQRFRLPIPPGQLRALRPSISHCALTFWIDAAKMPDAGTVYYRAVVGGEELEEKQAHVRVLPELPEGPRPRRFRAFFCWDLFDDVPEPLHSAVYDMVRRRMGVAYLLGAYGELKGWRKMLEDGLQDDGGSLWANVGGNYRRLAEGRGWETRVVAQGKEAFAFDDEYLRKMAPRVDGVFWDWEPANGLHNPLWDHAPTVAAFAQREGLDQGELTLDKLKGELRDRFLAFRTWQLAQVVRLWAEHVHEIKPELDIAICQGSGMPPDRHVDYRAYDDIPRVIHLPMIYTSGAMSFAKNVAGMRAYLPQAKLFPMTCTGMVADGGWLAAKSPRAIYFDFVTSALQGCMGCSHWPNLCRGFDMEYIWEVSRAMRDIACVEDVLLDGEPDPAGVTIQPLPESEARIKTATGELLITSPQWDRFALCYTHRLGERSLVSVCNMHESKAATVEVRIEDAAGAPWLAYDPVTRVALVPGSRQRWAAKRLAAGVMYEVPPASLGMLTITRQAPEGGFSGRVKESGVRKRFERRREETRAKGDVAGLQDDGLEISWADMDGDGNAEVRIASEHQELGIGPSGNLWSWKVRGHGEDLVNRFDGGGACQDRFWWPEGARASSDGSAEYELVTREIKGGRATVVCRRALSHWALGGLVIEKTYSIGKTDPRFDLRVTVRNESPTVHELSYWSHNCFRVGNTPSLTLTGVDGPETFAGTQQPREIWTPWQSLPDEQAPLLKKPNAPALAKASLTLGDPAGTRLVVTADPGSLLQVYRWWDGTEGGRYTLEWMYRKHQLLTGHMWTTRFSVEAKGSPGKR